MAEPALSVLAGQTNLIMGIVNKTAFIWIMGTGFGVFVGLALFRIMKNLNIKIVFTLMYAIVFIIAIFVPEEFIVLSFDGSGATTGDVFVPFILALGLGVSTTMSKHKTNEDTFGIIGIASVGPILALFIYGIILRQHRTILMVQSRRQAFRQTIQNDAGNSKSIAKEFCAG